MKKTVKKAREILLKPSNFFKKIKKERGIRHPVRYLIVFLLITNIFTVFYYMRHVFTKMGFDIDLTIGNYVLIYVVLTISTLIISFVRPALTNFFIRWYSDDNKFEDTYKAMIYGLTPDYLATPFFLITVILLTVTVLLQNAFLLLLFFVSAIISLIASIYTIYLRIYGVAKLHKISKWKSFLCIYIYPVLLIIAMEIIILGLMLSFFWIKS